MEKAASDFWVAGEDRFEVIIRFVMSKKIQEIRCRAALADSRRIIIKVGTRVLSLNNGRPAKRRMQNLVGQIACLRRDGFEILLVTSGAVGAGMQALGIKQRPRSVPELQMCAAVGQTLLMSAYSELFAQENMKIGQVLLTHSDFSSPVRMANARRTLEHLFKAGIVPIVNENDAVSDEEIKAALAWGDNDYLAALLVKLVRSDLLMLLTTVDGFREVGMNGRSNRVRLLESVSRAAFVHVRDLDGATASGLSRGGMSSKLKAARLAARAGCHVVIANGRARDIMHSIVAGKDVGTLVLPSAK